MEFTFWEMKSVTIPKGPLYGTLGFLGAIGLVSLLGSWAGSLAGGKEVKFSGATLPELKEWEKTVSSGDPVKMDELLQKEGGRIGADLNKWALISKWKDAVLLKLYQDDLLLSLRSQIKALEAAEAAAKNKGKEAAEPAAEPAAGGGETKAEPAPAKQ